MEQLINNLLGHYEKGALSRRELVGTLALLALGSQSVSAAEFESSSLNHVSIVVSNLQRSIEFYQKTFGLPVQSEDKATETVLLKLGKNHLSIRHRAGPTGRTSARRGGSARTRKEGPAARGAAQDKTVVCLTPATALEDPSSVRANGVASARNPRRSHWVKAQTAIRRPGRSRNADSRAPWRRAHIRSSRRPAGPRRRLAS